MTHPGRYRYSLAHRKNRWVDHHWEKIFGYSQQNVHEMGAAVLQKIIHIDDRLRVADYHRKLKYLECDGGEDQIYCRAWTKDGTLLFVRFLDRCVACDDRGQCTEIEGEALPLSQQDYDARKLLETAIADGEFGFYYQPVCDLASGTIAGYEALARWFRPNGQVLPPSMWLHLLEGTTLERRWIASQVGQVVQTLDRLPPGVWLSYNLSQSAIDSGNAWPVMPLARATNLHIEILEGAQVQTERALAHLKFIHQCGHELFADDVGQGYSLPTILSDVPLSGIKLDRILTQGIPHHPDTCVLVAGILDWAKAKGWVTVSEWVGTDEQAQWLRWHGCQYGQGALYGLAGELPL